MELTIKTNILSNATKQWLRKASLEEGCRAGNLSNATHKEVYQNTSTLHTLLESVGFSAIKKNHALLMSLANSGASVSDFVKALNT